MRIRNAIFATAFLIPVASLLQPAVLVKDVRTLADPSLGLVLRELPASGGVPTMINNAVRVGSSNPDSLTDLNGLLLYAAEDGSRGAELWRSDGTPQGTTLVKDISAGPASSWPQNLRRVNALVFFSATDPEHGSELWKTDGTAAGTTVIDVVPGPGSSYAGPIVNFNGVLYFLNPAGLWKTDGTAGGTVQIAVVSKAHDLIEVGGRLFFIVGDPPVFGDSMALWGSDGTPEGTALVSGPYHRIGTGTAFRGWLYFVATNWPITELPSVTNLFQSDGTAAGTRRAGPPGGPAVASGSLFVGASSGIYRIDTPGGSGRPVTETGSRLTASNGSVFFVRVFNPGSDELWKVDVADDATTPLGAFSSAPTAMAGVHGDLFFSGDDGTTGAEPWISDGTPEGARILQDIFPGPGCSLPAGFTLSEAGLFFSADDGTHGRELWLLPATSLAAASAVTVGIYRPSDHAWYLRNSNSSGFGDVLAYYGTDGDVPVAGDWDGDGIDTIGVYRPSEHAWYLRNSNSSGFGDLLAYYGIDGDVPVVGDWDGDGIDTIGVYRPSEHGWYLRNANTSGAGDVLAYYGSDGDVPVVGDWDGDGIDSIGVHRASEHAWYLRGFNSSGFNTVPAILYGIPDDRAVVGNWNGR